jgi:LPXTG-motif cell wall-anchored protein
VSGRTLPLTGSNATVLLAVVGSALLVGGALVVASARRNPAR